MRGGGAAGGLACAQRLMRAVRMTSRVNEYLAPVQDLPFTYRFAYTVEGVEMPLVSSEQVSSQYKDFYLPAGAGSNGTIGLVTYVTSAFGAVARGNRAADRSSLSTVSCVQNPEATNSATSTAYIQDSIGPLLLITLSQGQVSNVLNNVAIMSQVRASSIVHWSSVDS
jgi:hypothetical protein